MAIILHFEFCIELTISPLSGMIYPKGGNPMEDLEFMDEALELARIEAQETPEDWNKIYHRLRGMLRNRPTQRQEKD